MNKITFCNLENLVRKLRVLEPTSNPSIYHHGSYYGVRVRGRSLDSNVLEIIRYCFPFLYFVQIDTFNRDYFLFTFSFKYLNK